MPFLFKRMLKNSGFMTGAVGFLIIIFLLSNMIWDIEINGAKPATEYKIRQELDKLGVKIGKLQFFVKNVEGVQRELTDNIGDLTWVGVELNGTTYQLQVVEKNEPKAPETLAPQNLVAKKKAIIVKTFVEEGEKMVDTNDHVEEGQLLVSGEIGQDGQKPRQVAARGEVWGETWYKTNVKLPLETTFQVYTGNEERKYLLSFWKFKIPVWGFNKSKFKAFETETNVHKLHFLQWKLPITYCTQTIRESEEIPRTYTVKEAEENALDLARKQIKSQLDEDATFKDEKILHKEVKNGKVILDIHFKMIENIAVGQPIPKETHE